MTPLDTYLGLRAFVDELARCGLRHACTSPGSRSTPLVLSLAREPRLEVSSHVDERSAGFYALGAAKASGQPVALACTSGTAAANYTPAVFEAFEARVALLVLTADRPPELRGVGAGQVIDQVKLYGSAVKWFVEVDDAPLTAERARWLRGLACRAFATAMGARPGPVHLNFSFREPLVLEEPLPADDPVPGRADGRPWLELRREARTTPGEVASPPRTLVVAGRWERGDGAGLARECAQAGVPLLADPLSGARRGDAAIAHYDAFLRVRDDLPEPDVIVRVGDLPTSKPLRSWLGRSTAEQWLVDPELAWQNPASQPARILDALPAFQPGEPEVLSAWREADRRALAGFGDVIAGAGLSEPGLIVALFMSTPPGATLLVASSMPVRDVETFWPVLPDGPRILANRGANGIDGTVATAYGIAAATGGHVTCLLGDVALLHDAGSLITHGRTNPQVRFVVVNNDGGGIFEFLPVARQPEFEALVATPHGTGFEKLAAAAGIAYTLAKDNRDVVAGTGLIEVRTDRQANVALHREIWEAVRAAASVAPAMQDALFEAPRRTTSKHIGPGDIVQIDKKGRRFFAQVTALTQSPTGYFELEVCPLERGITWRTATVREVVDVWRKVIRRP